MGISWTAQPFEITAKFVPIEIERIVNDVLLQCLLESISRDVFVLLVLALEGDETYRSWEFITMLINC